MGDVLDINRLRDKKYASGVIQAIAQKSPTTTYRGVVVVSRTIADWFRSQACGAHVEDAGLGNVVITLYPCDVDPSGSAKKIGFFRFWRAKRKRETWQTDSHKVEMDLDALLAYAAQLLGVGVTFRVSRSIPGHVIPYTTASAVDSIVEKQRKYWRDAGL